MNQNTNNYPTFEDINDDSIDLVIIIRLMLMVKNDSINNN